MAFRTHFPRCLWEFCKGLTKIILVNDELLWQVLSPTRGKLHPADSWACSQVTGTGSCNMALKGPLWAATDPDLPRGPQFCTLAWQHRNQELCVNSASHNERHCTHAELTQGCTGNQCDENTNHRRTKFKKCPKMCILFHIIIQCLHTGILLRLLKESVKKVRQIPV